MSENYYTTRIKIGQVGSEQIEVTATCFESPELSIERAFQMEVLIDKEIRTNHIRNKAKVKLYEEYMKKME